MVWMWRDTGDCATNHDISYARSRDLVTWEAGDRSTLPLPITIEANPSIVDPVPAGGGLINMCQSLGFDSADRPVVSYHKHDEQGNTQAYASRLEDGVWRVYKLSDWDYRWDFSGGGSIGAEIRLGGASISEEGHLSMTWWHLKKGAGIWKLDESTLSVVGDYPLPEPELPEALMKPTLDYPGMSVRTASERRDTQDDTDDFYDEKTAAVVRRDERLLLRWETLPANRDRPREEIPPPSELRLYVLGRP
jgi:hypothetical protein